MGIKGPQEQSMRNAGGAAFRSVIAAYAEEFGRPSKPASTSEDEAMLAGISDQRVAARVRLLIADNKSLGRRVDLLHSALRQVKPITVGPHGTIEAQVAETNTLHAVGSGIATEAERRSVRRFLANLPEINCSVDQQTGALLHDSGVEVASPGFGQLLQRLLASQSKTSP
jgi:hypothetical protein